MIAREERVPRSLRRFAVPIGIALLAIVILVPLTSTDAAQQAGLPLLADKLWFRIATTVAMFVVMASAWNIIGGLTGYASFGNVAFFGLGAYTVGVLVSNRGWPFALALIAAPLTATVFALIVGIPLLRLRGHYFAVATLGIGVAVGEVVNNLAPLGASTGLFLPIVRSDLLFFYLMLGAAALAVCSTWPGSIVKVTPARALTPPKRLLTSRTASRLMRWFRAGFDGDTGVTAGSGRRRSRSRRAG